MTEMEAVMNDLPPPHDTFLTQRQSQIVKIVREQGYASIEALAKVFDVSAQSVRRDIIRLDELQILQRFHGGAGLRGNTVRLGYAQKKTISSHGKEAIGQFAAGLIPENASVFLDVGTTVEAVAKALRAKHRLSVVTTSLPAAALLAGRQGIDVFVTGGQVQGADGSLIGETAIAGIGRFKTDYAVFGCSGFEDDGTVMDFDLRKVEVKQAMLANCRHAVLVADHAKFERSAIVRLAPVGAFQTLVTDADPPHALQAAMEAGGTRLVVADAPTPVADLASGF